MERLACHKHSLICQERLGTETHSNQLIQAYLRPISPLLIDHAVLSRINSKNRRVVRTTTVCSIRGLTVFGGASTNYSQKGAPAPIITVKGRF